MKNTPNWIKYFGVRVNVCLNTFKLNNWSQKSLLLYNLAGKIAYDEAVSINIITNRLSEIKGHIINNICYESQIKPNKNVTLSRPDYIINTNVGFIFVSVTRAISWKWDRDVKALRNNYTVEVAKILLCKKVRSLKNVYNDRYEFINSSEELKKNMVFIIHVLAPTQIHITQTINAYNYLLDNDLFPKQINLIITLTHNQDHLYHSNTRCRYLSI